MNEDKGKSFELATARAQELIAQGYKVAIARNFLGDGWPLAVEMDFKDAIPGIPAGVS